MTPLAEILIFGLTLVVMYVFATNNSRKQKRRREIYRKLIECSDYQPDQAELFREYITYHNPSLDDMMKLEQTVRKYCTETGKFRATLLDRIETYSKQLKEKNFLDTAYNENSRNSSAETNKGESYVTCPACNHPTRSNGKFCGHCGKPLTQKTTAWIS